MDYCRNLIRERDYNRYLLSFFVPRQIRDDLLSILALNVELQSIPEKTTEAPAAFIRLQWWSDQIDCIFNNEQHSPSPILDGLKQAIHGHAIPQALFDDHFNCYDLILRGEPQDINDTLYPLCASVLKNKRDKDRFSKVLMHHDRLDENTKFRALRLWLGF
jgi:hypothetical protein